MFRSPINSQFEPKTLRELEGVFVDRVNRHKDYMRGGGATFLCYDREDVHDLSVFPYDKLSDESRFHFSYFETKFTPGTR